MYALGLGQHDLELLYLYKPFVLFVQPSLFSGGLLNSFDKVCTSWGGLLILLMVFLN